MGTCAYQSINHCPFADHASCPFSECPGEGVDNGKSATTYVDAPPAIHKDSLFVIESVKTPGNYLADHTSNGVNIYSTNPRKAIQFTDLESGERFCKETFSEDGQVNYIPVEIVTETHHKNGEDNE